MEEGRSLESYTVIAWDGSHISFGRSRDGSWDWEALVPFDHRCAKRLLRCLREDGMPLVHPLLLAQLVGPESPFGNALIPELFSSIITAAVGGTSKTKLLYLEWRRLFGQVVGIQSDDLRALLERQGRSHRRNYAPEAAAYLFALNTYIALIAKLVSACALARKRKLDVRDASIPIEIRLKELENGKLFLDAGIANMLSGDFFSWYRDDPRAGTFLSHVDDLASAISGINFDVTLKSSESTRDLFKGIYLSFVPRELRHALGEFYTPDWLAAHAIDLIGWTPEHGLIDPTCGSGTFLLEVLRRRLLASSGSNAEALLEGIVGFDLNPLAVLCAKGSLAVFLAPYLNAKAPLRLPVYLADAINPANERTDACFQHDLMTERGTKRFVVPSALVRHRDFYEFFRRVGDLVDEGMGAASIVAAARAEFGDITLAQDH